MVRPLIWLPRVVLAALIAVSAACGSAPRADEGSPFDRAATDESVRLTVQNNDFLDAVIYAHWNGLRTRVGMVTGKTTTTFTLEWRGEFIRLEVEFIGSDDGYTSDLASVTQGDHLDFVILPRTGRPTLE